VSRWFDRRRGTALALLGSGSSVSAAIWAPIFAPAEAQIGWRNTMLGFAVIEVSLILPAAALMLGPAPEPRGLDSNTTGPRMAAPVLGLRPAIALSMLAAAGFCCCVPMAMPQGHLVALCTDVGVSASIGAAMPSMLLGLAFLSRRAWGLVADRIGGLCTIFAGSVCQLLAMVGFLATQSEAGFFTVSAVFGLGFSGIIPVYVLTVRELFSGVGGVMARSNGTAIQRLGHGIWRLACRCDLRLRRLLCDRFRHWHRLQSGASGALSASWSGASACVRFWRPPTPLDDEWNQEHANRARII
jgi:nitrate/nitrite transporter NarK